MTNEKHKFNWLALLFSSAYYGGKGKITKGLVFAIIGFIPLTQIIVGIYAGKNANKELSDNQFSWGKAILVFACHALITALSFEIISFIKR